MNQRSQKAVRRTVGGPSTTTAATTTVVAAACVATLLLLIVVETAAAPSTSALDDDTVAAVSSLLRLREPSSRRLHKRSFFDLQCKGVYDKRIFATLDRICEDCYNLFREPSIHSLCRKNCFTTNFFKGCVDTLQLQEKEEEIKEMIKQLHGADPGL